VDDPLLVELLVVDDPRGLAGVYDRYADRLYAYCVTLLQDRDAAADAVHDTLLIARERAAQLRDPDRLRPWLYAIARNECMRMLRGRQRDTGLDEAGDVADLGADPEAGIRAGEMRELIWSAAASLNPREREVLELSVRHGLEGQDLADALGVASNHAHALMSRARTQLELALSALILARTGRQDCAELDRIVGDWDGVLTPLLRKRIGKHLERCEICGEQRRRRVSAVALLSGLPLLAAPPMLRDRVMRDAGDMRLVSMWEALAAQSGPYRPDGFPLPFGRDRKRKMMIGYAAAGIAVLLALAVGTAVVLPAGGAKTPAGDVAALGQSTSAPVTDDLSTTVDDPSSTVDSTTPGATATPTPTPTNPTSAPPTLTTDGSTVVPPPAAPPVVGPPGITAQPPTRPTTTRPSTVRPPSTPPSTPPSSPPSSNPNPQPPSLRVSHDEPQCGDFTGLTLHATVANPPAGGAVVTATWTDPNGGPHSEQMKGDGTTFTTFASGMSPRLPFSWTAGTKGADPAGETFTPCPPSTE
jgi:RNA polymerase sigma factor (sigma-70 family)